MKSLFEASMYPFIEMFPDVGRNECRVAHIRGQAKIPDDSYAFIELYCTYADCNCNRVMINVIATSSWKHLATINYGFGTKEDMKGPFLDSLNEQSKNSGYFLSLFKEFLKDRGYVSRLKKHYRMVKKALGETDHPIHDRIQGNTD